MTRHLCQGERHETCLYLADEQLYLSGCRSDLGAIQSGSWPPKNHASNWKSFSPNSAGKRIKNNRINRADLSEKKTGKKKPAD